MLIFVPLVMRCGNFSYVLLFSFRKITLVFGKFSPKFLSFIHSAMEWNVATVRKYILLDGRFAKLTLKFKNLKSAKLSVQPYCVVGTGANSFSDAPMRNSAQRTQQYNTMKIIFCSKRVGLLQQQSYFLIWLIEKVLHNVGAKL